MPPTFRIGGTGFGGSCRKIVEAPQSFWISRHGRAAIVAARSLRAGRSLLLPAGTIALGGHMKRRRFLAASIAASTLAAAGKAVGQTSSTGASATGAPVGPRREFYQLRRYNLFSGQQLKVTESYFSGALIPALARLGLGPVGAFKLDIGPETPAYYLLIPGPSVEMLAELDLRLPEDAEFLKAADTFWNATSAAPAFQRAEISLLAAFKGWPKLTPPPAAATKTKRIFQLRTYESPSDGEHVRKVEMFHSGEFEIFPERRLPSRLFWRHAHWVAHAQPYLHAQLRRSGRARRQVGCLPQRSSVEETVRQPALRFRPDRHATSRT
jgi:hypothetical protein